METMTTRLRMLIRQGRTPDEAADMALEGVTAKDLRIMVRPLLLIQARRFAREKVRQIENAVRLSPGTALTRPDAMRALLDSTFALPSGEHVRWSVATIEQHQERASMFMVLAEANAEKAGRHEQAAELLRNTGALNLGALYDKGEDLKELAA